MQSQEAEGQCTNQQWCRNEYTTGRWFYRTAWNLTEVPHHIPAEAQEVHLDLNAITAIPDGVFSHLTQCKHLNMGYNKIASIDKKSFSGMESLQKLSLYNNKISSLDQETWLPVKFLTYLDLNTNLFTTIMSEMFNGLSFLSELRLCCNKISVIEEGAFDHLYSLKVIWLHTNRLRTLNPDLFVNLPRRLEIRMGQTSDRNQLALHGYICRSLCWLKHEEQHQSWFGGGSTYWPRCVDISSWGSLQCGDKGICYFGGSLRKSTCVDLPHRFSHAKRISHTQQIWNQTQK